MQKFAIWVSLLLTELSRIVNSGIMKSDIHTGVGDRKTFKEGLDVLQKALSERGFSVETDPISSPGSEDAEIVIHPGKVRLTVNVKPSIHTALSMRRVIEPVNAKWKSLLIVPRLTSTTFDECRAIGLCVADTEGNILLNVPGLYLERYRQKVRSSKPTSTGTVFTARASRLVRALLSKYPQTCQQSDLAEQTGVSPGYVSTRIQAMEKEGYVTRTGGLVRLVEPDRFLTDWSQRCRFDRHLRFRYAISMASYEQGLDKLHQELTRLNIRYAFTGWSGAFLAAPYGEPESIMAYVSSAPKEASLRALSPVESGSDVILLVPHDEGVFQFCNADLHKGPVVSYGQLYVDLTNMTGRAPEQAEVLRKKRLMFKEVDA